MSLVFISDIILTSIALICLIIASITDIKKREVADWLSFFLIAFALAIRAIVASLENNLNYFLYALIFGAIVFLIVILLYYSKVLGGGDAKLLVALACVFATTPSFLNFDYGLIFSISRKITHFFLFDFFVNCLFVGLVYSLVFSIFLALKNKKSFLKTFKKLNQKNVVFKIASIIFGFAFFIMAIVKSISILLVLAIFLLIIPYLYTFIKSVESSALIKLKPWQKLTEGDWLIQEIKLKGKTIKPSADGLTKQDILAIKKANKKVLIRDGLPFVPVFLLAVISCLLLGNLLFRLLIILL